MPLIYVRYKMRNGKVVETPFTDGLEDALFVLASRGWSYISWWYADDEAC